MAYLYPSTLPEPAINGNTMSSNRTFNRTRFDHGFRHRRLPDTHMMVEFTFLLKSSAQMQAFMDFYYDYLDYGVNEFEANWEVTGFFTETKVFRFTDTFLATPLRAQMYSVSAKFQVVTPVGDIVVGGPELVVTDAENLILNSQGLYVVVDS